MLVLAEISDKVGSPVAIFAASLVFASVGFALSRLRWWLAVLLVPVLVLWNIGVCHEWQEPVYGQLLIKELGYGRLALDLIAMNGPTALVCWAVARNRKGQMEANRARLSLCKTCAYPTVGVDRCPECGRDVADQECVAGC